MKNSIKQRESARKNLTTHGMFYTRFYKTWAGAKARCNNPREKAYKYYGGRGIKFSWNRFEDFRDDMYSSYLKHVSDFGIQNTQLDRIDNNGNYTKKNCKWSTLVEQANNKRNIHRMFIKEGWYSVSELVRQYGMKASTFYCTVSRLKK